MSKATDEIDQQTEQLRRRLERLELAERLERDVLGLKDELVPARKKVGEIQRAINKKEAELHQCLQPLPLFDAEKNGHSEPTEEWLKKSVSDLGKHGLPARILQQMQRVGLNTYAALVELDKKYEGNLADGLSAKCGLSDDAAQQVAQTFYRLAKKETKS